ncbi:hypothetical protein ACTA71_004567 [Dictyostelium dimigraforme]
MGLASSDTSQIFTTINKWYKMLGHRTETEIAFNIWYLNILLYINSNNECNTLQKWYIIQLESKKAISESLKELVNYWSLYKQMFHPIHNKITTLPSCIRNSKDKHWN